MTSDVDVLIIGAGPAGSIAASVLHREGFRALVVEKQQFPRFVIGESLLPRVMNLLREAGLLEAVEKQGFMRKTGAVFRRGAETCNFDFSEQSGDGWPYTFQVTRADFDKTLADTVAGRGVEICYGHGVSAVKFDESVARITIEQPDQSVREVTAKFVLDCSGYGRVLPKLLNLDKPSTQAFRESLFTHVTGDQRPKGDEGGKIWVCIHPDGAWIWIIPFSNGKTSVGVVATPEFYQKFPGEPAIQLRAILMSDPNAAVRVGKTEFVFPPRRIGGYSCSVKQFFGPHCAGGECDGISRSGFQFGRHAGNGVRDACGTGADQRTARTTSGLEDGICRSPVARCEHFSCVRERMVRRHALRHFFAPDRDMGVMRNICSVLAGYVWDKSNPYVTQAERALGLLSQVVTGG